MPLVKMPTGETVDLPDVLSPQQEAQLRLVTSPSALPQQQEQPQSGTDVFLRRLGLLTRAGLTGVSGSATLLADGLNAIDNKWHGTDTPRPSEQLQGVLTKAGLPTPESPDEHLATALTTIGSGLVGDPVGALSKAAPSAEALARYNTLREGQAQGFRLSPSVAGGNPVGRVLETVTGKRALRNALKEKNSEVASDLVRTGSDLGDATFGARFAEAAPEVIGKPTQRSNWEGAMALSRGLGGAAVGSLVHPLLGAAASYPTFAYGTRQMLTSPVGQALFANAARPGQIPASVRALPSMYQLGSGLFNPPQE